MKIIRRPVVVDRRKCHVFLFAERSWGETDEGCLKAASRRKARLKSQHRGNVFDDDNVVLLWQQIISKQSSRCALERDELTA